MGYIVLLLIKPDGRGRGHPDGHQKLPDLQPRAHSQLKYLGSTLVKTAPLLMCSLSILFAYKVGLFNIGAAGQYVRRRVR